MLRWVPVDSSTVTILRMIWRGQSVRSVTFQGESALDLSMTEVSNEAENSNTHFCQVRAQHISRSVVNFTLDAPNATASSESAVSQCPVSTTGAKPR